MQKITNYNPKRETRILMGMPITVEIVDREAAADCIERVFAYFAYIDEKFSTYKETSEITNINKGRIGEHEWSDDMREVLRLAEATRQETGGYFDIVKNREGYRDPSGIVKGWAIHNAARMLEAMGCKNYYIDAGGDIALSGRNRNGAYWRVGIRHPFEPTAIAKVIIPRRGGVATSGTYERGRHIYNPKDGYKKIDAVVSITVVGPNIYEADRFATAAFAMGANGIAFIERYPGLEGYQIDRTGRATMTSGFSAYAA